ncbi:MAG: hypothetical protein SPL19_08435 [Fibrobacter sp.]|nr:hypothetical protein [Fibrobacter sp.]MDY6369473.1 hypothetical protein [Fibrobacter sp.]MDY6390369.1 hypothetical protein [Fibrobacter sp.]
MSLEVALSFLLYAFVSGITPGPANLCSLSVAMKTGKSVAIKQWYGLFTGYTIVALASVFIVYFISSAFESFIEVFSFIGAIYIAYLAISLLLQGIFRKHHRIFYTLMGLSLLSQIHFDNAAH